MVVIFTWVRLMLMVYGGSKMPLAGTFGAPLAAYEPLRQSILHLKSVAGVADPAQDLKGVGGHTA